MRCFNCCELLVIRLLTEADTFMLASWGSMALWIPIGTFCPSWDVFKRFQTLLKEEGEAAFVLANRDCTQGQDQTKYC